MRWPLIPGCEGVGLDDEGREVIVYPVMGDAEAGRGDPMLDPGWEILSTEHDGTFAETVVVPAGNLVPKPPELSFGEAACLPASWLTAYRMLVEKAALGGPGTVLVQGAGGGVSTALISLAAEAGHRVRVTGRTEAGRAQALGSSARSCSPCRGSDQAAGVSSMESTRSG